MELFASDTLRLSIYLIRAVLLSSDAGVKISINSRKIPEQNCPNQIHSKLQHVSSKSFHFMNSLIS